MLGAAFRIGWQSVSHGGSLAAAPPLLRQQQFGGDCLAPPLVTVSYFRDLVYQRDLGCLGEQPPGWVCGHFNAFRCLGQTVQNPMMGFTDSVLIKNLVQLLIVRAVDQHSGRPCIDFLENPKEWNGKLTMSSILLAVQVPQSGCILAIMGWFLEENLPVAKDLPAGTKSSESAAVPAAYPNLQSTFLALGEFVLLLRSITCHLKHLLGAMSGFTLVFNFDFSDIVPDVFEDPAFIGNCYGWKAKNVKETGEWDENSYNAIVSQLIRKQRQQTIDEKLIEIRKMEQDNNLLYQTPGEPKAREDCLKATNGTDLQQRQGSEAVADSNGPVPVYTEDQFSIFKWRKDYGTHAASAFVGSPAMILHSEAMWFHLHSGMSVPLQEEWQNVIKKPFCGRKHIGNDDEEEEDDFQALIFYEKAKKAQM
ncbi:Ubiquitin-conjugating enzyme E2 U [Chelonia mydas]|uniref:Ubiquitin-conjugating enzyme E2 U n=1 Tax=Chelonia mydas TaxID=8469 RepID=M7BK33_CHEMY|nr:Ubiquitin-conjugating enzyme E2 U [Chelonia mydas]